MGLFSRNKTIGTITAAFCVIFAGVVILQAVFSRDSATIAAQSTTDAQAQTKKDNTQKVNIGPSGLPLPRFVSLKAERVNVRRGPSSDHKIAWVFNRKGMPVEIIAEYEHWRRVRDNEGDEGWVYRSLLTGKRTIMVAPWRKEFGVVMRATPDKNSNPVALLKAGVIGTVESCTGEWCRVTTSGYDGWLEQAMLWGVYPHETIDN